MMYKMKINVIGWAVVLVVVFFISMFIWAFVERSQEKSQAVQTPMGYVTDIESVNPGGFGSSDLCVVKLSENNKITMSGRICSNLAVGQRICRDSFKRAFVKC